MFFLACVFSLAGPEAAIGQTAGTFANPAAALQAKYTVLQKELSHNPFSKPVRLDSNENSKDLLGEIYAVVDYPFPVVSSALESAPPWCDILNLHLNVKYCHPQGDRQHQSLSVYVGRKYEQPLGDATHIAFAFGADTKVTDYLQVILNAEAGPYGARNCRIIVEAVPVESSRTFIHLSYSYEAGLAATLALHCYLNTLGSDKVGFTVVGKKPDGQPLYAGDVRGVVERNTMRYYLAVDAYLSALSTPPDQRLEKRLQNWFSATERYPLQLHEMEWGEYLAMKRKEYQRQIAGP
jgi:hypothetical protein